MALAATHYCVGTAVPIVFGAKCPVYDLDEYGNQACGCRGDDPLRVLNSVESCTDYVCHPYPNVSVTLATLAVLASTTTAAPVPLLPEDQDDMVGRRGATRRGVEPRLPRTTMALPGPTPWPSSTMAASSAVPPAVPLVSPGAPWWGWMLVTVSSIMTLGFMVVTFLQMVRFFLAFCLNCFKYLSYLYFDSLHTLLHKKRQLVGAKAVELCVEGPSFTWCEDGVKGASCVAALASVAGLRAPVVTVHGMMAFMKQKCSPTFRPFHPRLKEQFKPFMMDGLAVVPSPLAGSGTETLVTVTKLVSNMEDVSLMKSNCLQCLKSKSL